MDHMGSCLSHHIKLWADKHSCTGEIKGGTVNLKHHNFVVTSNYHPRDLFGGGPEKESLCVAIEERFEIIQMLCRPKE